MKIYLILYLIFGFGILWHSLSFTRGIVLELTPFVLLITYILVLYPEFKNRNFKVIGWFVGVFLCTFFIEVIGISTGKIFGTYEYGNTLGIKFLSVPVIIGANWALVIWGCAGLVSRTGLNLIAKTLISAAAAVFLDLFIEPAAAPLDYWKWAGDIIPFQNYAAWFIIAIIFSASYFMIRHRQAGTMPVHFYFSQLIFFIMINITVV